MKFKVFLCCFFVIIIFSSVYTETELYEGDECTTKDNEPGIFKDVEDCKDYFIIMRNKHGNNVVNHLVRGQQKPNKQFIFCCKSNTQQPTARQQLTTKQPTTQKPTTQQPTTQKPTTQQPTTQQPTTQQPTTQQPTSPPDIISKTNSRSELACQKYQRIELNFSTRFRKCLGNIIYGGYNADINEFPHMVAIGFEKENNALDYDFDCGGSLISEKFVLTAVHCLNKRNQVPKIVRLGKTSLNNANRLDCHQPIDVNIVSKNLHSNYGHESKHNDIALLELERSVEQYFNRNLLPACLHHKLELINDLTITGWGFVSKDDGKFRKDWLQKAENMTEISLSSCKERFEELIADIVETQICITHSQFADACQGDSGGPLSYKNNKLHYIAGVVSYGSSCGGNLPGIYTRVSSYIDWIENIVWPQT